MGLIRLLLAVAVAVGHASGASFFPGKTAVQVFYIISGFYMSLILNEKYLKKKGSYKLFITNRLLRLYPTYWVVLVLTIVFSLGVYQASGHHNASYLSPYFQYHQNLNFISAGYLLFTNVFIFFQDIVCFLGIDPHSGNLYFTNNFYASNPVLYSFLLIPQAWTVGLELAYYLIAPFIVRRSLYIILVLALMSFATRIILIKIGLYRDPWNYRFFPSEVMFFLLGNISYKIYLYVKGKIDVVKWAVAGSKLAFLVMVLFTIFYGSILDIFEPKYIQVLYFLLFFCTLPFIFLYTKKSKTDRFIGELSYPVYICHMLFIEAGKVLHIPGGLVFTCITIVLSILFSILINRLLIERIERYRQSRVQVS